MTKTTLTSISTKRTLNIVLCSLPLSVITHQTITLYLIYMYMCITYTHSDMRAPVSTRPLRYSNKWSTRTSPNWVCLLTPYPVPQSLAWISHALPSPFPYPYASIYIQQPHTHTLFSRQSTRFYWKAWENKVFRWDLQWGKMMKIHWLKHFAFNVFPCTW